MKKTLIYALVISLIIQCTSAIMAFANVGLTGEGLAENPYLIGTLDELIAFRDKVNSGETTACAQLTADITVGQWTPIGTTENKYAGTFDGAGYEITGIKGSGSNDAAWGLFAYTNGGEIKDLTVRTESDNVLNIGHRAGLIVAFASNDTKITKCAGYGNLSGWGYIGGITYDGDCVVTDSYYVGNISGAHNITAMGLKAAVTNSFVYGNVTATTHAFRLSNKSAENSYFLNSKGDAGTGGYGTQKSAEAFASGELVSLLGDAFGQTIGVDKHPVFKTDSNSVYENTLGGYSNAEAEDGSSEKPYTIANAEALNTFRNLVNSGSVNLNAKLGADINLNNASWTPIGTNDYKYAGTFDGAGFTISGINGSGSQWGFFKYTNGGEIKNLTIKAGNSGNINVGHQSALFVAIAENNTKISKCAGYANISIPDGYVGGITCQGACTVTDCYYVGNISGVNWVTGMGFNAVATNCFVYGNIKGTSTAFKVANGSGTSHDKNFYLSVESPSAYGYGTQKSTDAFASGEVAYLLGDAFGQTIGEDEYPVFKTSDNGVYFVNNVSYTNDSTENGTAEKPYTIGSYTELNNFRTAVNSGNANICAVLTKDIDVSSETKWTPIGTNDYKYAGTFDGAGFSINGINGSGTQWGFFKYTNGGEIKNLTIKAGNNGTINAGHQSAFFVGVASNDTKITNCAGYGDISVNDGFVGGITSDGACIVDNCYFVGDVTGVNRASAMGYNAKVSNSFAYGNITATKEGNGYAFKLCNGSAENSYYLASSGVSGTGGYGTQMSEEQFANGEVAYLINKGAGNIIYGQTIGTEEYPNPENDTVVYKKLDGTYSNSEGAFVSFDGSEAVIISATDAIAFIAQYGATGDLKIANPIVLKAGDAYETEIISAEGATLAKILVWDSLININPIAKVEEHTFN